jgi:hypothetical protein
MTLMEFTGHPLFHKKTASGNRMQSQLRTSWRDTDISLKNSANNRQYLSAPFPRHVLRIRKPGPARLQTSAAFGEFSGVFRGASGAFSAL